MPSLVTGGRTRGGRRAEDWDEVRGDVGAHAGCGAACVEAVGVEAKTRVSSRGAETDELGCMSGRESLQGRRGARELLSKTCQVAGTDEKRQRL
jgi:hypothetical protein